MGILFYEKDLVSEGYIQFDHFPTILQCLRNTQDLFCIIGQERNKTLLSFNMVSNVIMGHCINERMGYLVNDSVGSLFNEEKKENY